MPFQCPVCSYAAPSRRSAAEHARSHNSYTCHLCGRRCGLLANFQRHLASHEKDGRQCKKCGKEFARRATLLAHQKWCGIERPRLQCPHCDFSAVTQPRVDAHIKRRHPHRRACEICGEWFHNLARLMNHRRMHAANPRIRRRAYTCPYCGLRVRSLLKRAKHLRQCTQRFDQLGGAAAGASGVVWESEMGMQDSLCFYRLTIPHNTDAGQDLNIALIENKAHLIDKLSTEVGRLPCTTVWASVRCEASKETEKHGLKQELKVLRSKNHDLLQADDLKKVTEDMILELIRASDEMKTQGSSWQITQIFFLELAVAERDPMAASSYLPLPPYLQNSKSGLINPKNNDHQCFRWCILAHLFAVPSNRHRVEQYRPYYDSINFGDMESNNFEIKNIPRFERLNQGIGITLVTEEDDRKKVFLPLYACPEKRAHNIALLLLKGPEFNHYVLIQDLDALLFSSTMHNEKKFFCRFCFYRFSSAEKRDAHSLNCQIHGTQKVVYPREGSSLSFDMSKYGNMVLSDFTLFFDFETMARPVELDEGKSTRRIREQVAVSYVIVVTDHTGEMKGRPYWHVSTEGGVAGHFISKVIEIEAALNTQRLDYGLDWTHIDWQRHEAASSCYLCGGAFPVDENGHVNKVPDHCHLKPTLNYLGAAHSLCNLARRRNRKLVCVAHNLQKFDGMLIFQAALDHPELAGKEIKLIPKTKTKYLTFSFQIEPKEKRSIVFIDSCNHWPESLESLVSGLRDEDLRVTSAVFPNPEQRALIHRKGVYPYGYFDDPQKYSEKELPDRTHFYNDLREEEVSEADYEHAKRVFAAFQCQDLARYTLLYNLCDTTLLADFWGAYRKQTWDVFRLEPNMFVSSASLSWMCALKMTGERLEYVTDPDMFQFCERSLRGGQSFVAHRSAVANHEGLPTWNPSEGRREIFSVDVNALYGGSMKSPLPVSDYRWLSDDEVQQLDLSHLQMEDDTGYLLEVDLEYPSHLHIAHSDFPLAPVRTTITRDMLTETMLAQHAVAGLEPSSKEVKLVAHLGPRRGYVVHALLLKKYVEWGLVVTRRHRGLRFQQKAWLKPYMDYVAEQRQAATTTFHSNFWKTQGNCVFGYSLKSNRHHVDVKIVRSRAEFLKCSRGGRLKSATLLNDSLAIVEMKPATLKLNNAVSVGCVILDLSKLFTYDIYFRLKGCWGENLQLLYHDTDSFIMCTSGPKTAHQGFAELSDLMDLSSFDVHHPLHSMDNFKIPLKLKVEHANKTISRFVGLRSKVYAVRFVGDGEDSLLKAKGVPRRSLQMQVDFDDFVKCREQGLSKSVNYQFIRNGSTHTLYTWVSRKVALRNLDTKRVTQEDGVSTRPYFFNPDAPDPPPQNADV